MRLYHGTSEAIARRALDEGLLPRAESGVESHWTECPSRDDLVYLTTAYAGYFAVHATKDLDRWGIVEVDTDLLPEESILVPDEDWLEQVTRDSPALVGMVLSDTYRKLQTMQERTAFWRALLPELAPLWLDSIEGLGNCAHVGAIPPEAITRVAIFDPRSNPSITMSAMDPMISTLNYAICGAKYRALVKWLMGDAITVEEYIGYGFLSSVMIGEQRTEFEAVLAERGGLEVIEVQTSHRQKRHHESHR
jgi:hypothetical protein